MPTTTSQPPPPPTRARAASGLLAPAAALDVACVLAFAAVGRASHAASGGVAGVLSTAWPFLVGCAAGWLVTRAWRRPTRVWPTGVAVWALTWAGGLALRGLAGGGPAPAFVVVAAAVLAALLLGWRAVATTVSSVRRRPVRPAADVRARRR